MQSLHSPGWKRVRRFVGMLAAWMAAVLMSQTVLAWLQTSPSNERERALDVLLAKDEISQQIFNYQRSLDRMDKDLGLQMIHPEGTWNGTTGENFLAGAWKMNSAFATHSHQMTNSTIKVTGDTAVSETYGMVLLRRPVKAGDKTMVTEIYVTRYLDRWSKRNGRWALDERKPFIIDMHMNVVEHLDPSQPNQQKSDGRRDRTDPVYQLFP
jgi:hypothetical protein